MRPVAGVDTRAAAAGSRLNGAPEPRRRRPGAGGAGRAAAACNNARLEPDGQAAGDPTEVALLQAARSLGADVDADRRDGRRRHQYNFDPQLQADDHARRGAGRGWLHTKGAPEAVLPRCIERPLRGRQRARRSTGRAERDHAAGRDVRAGGPARAGARPAAAASRCASPRRARRPSGSCASSGWSRCSTRPAPRSPTRSPAATARGSGSS